MINQKAKLNNMVFMGPPGVGKGTVAAIIANETGIIHLSTGNIFRQEIASKSNLGLQVAKIVETGGYVPDEITNEIVKKKLTSLINENHLVILDGYPRTLAQVKFLDSIEGFKYDVIELNAPEELILERLSGRRFCPECKASFHVSFMPSTKGNICDKCGAELMTRKDDSVESIKKRQEIYQAETQPLLDHYKNVAYIFDASGKPEDIAQEIIAKVSKQN
ncbi:adenylate kinase family protein [Mycoplasmopsis felifaucium]|uniref:adenylate kinase family protein n=1 Tax=Mycoplasmopsis felifaucium TaxID=35768 RepID=UPI00047FAA7B|nr:nucleoside monophosphate kinase [Mycoplasmopsis felifaucium]